MTAKRVLGALAAIGIVAGTLPAFGRDGLDVAPAGGFYSRRDIVNESPRRISHPRVGEPCAPSAVAPGPHRRASRIEMVMTARLNLHQIHRYGWPYGPMDYP